jgi:transcriptional regulator with XRE-family HTH domain
MCNALGQRFRDVIRYLRDRELIYNEAQLASKMGISRQFLSDMKNGRKEISEQTVLKLCELFPVLSAEWLISGVGSMVVEPAVHPPVVESVSIPGDAWEVIRLQAASLEKKDTQVDRLLDIIEGQLGVVPGGHKKNNRSSGGAGGSASGADHFAS